MADEDSHLAVCERPVSLGYIWPSRDDRDRERKKRRDRYAFTTFIGRDRRSYLLRSFLITRGKKDLSLIVNLILLVVLYS